VAHGLCDLDVTLARFGRFPARGAKMRIRSDETAATWLAGVNPAVGRGRCGLEASIEVVFAAWSTLLCAVLEHTAVAAINLGGNGNAER